MTSENAKGWSPENAPYWEATRAGKVLVKRCTDCGEPHYYPRQLCPFCGSLKTEWLTATGRGTIYSFSTLRRADPPYISAYVTLEEGVTMLTNLVDCDYEVLSIGQKVEVRFQGTGDGRQVPVFTPVP